MEPTYVPVKTVRNYKVTIIEREYKVHDGTNTVTEDIENVVMDDCVFQATSQELATFEALKQIETSGEVDMTNLKVTARPF